MSEVDGVTIRRLKLRYPSTCGTCGIALSAKTEAFWDREAKQATCLACAPPGGVPDAGVAGTSAAAEGERRASKRVERVRAEHGDHAAVVAAALLGSEAEASWGKGGEGERRLAAWVAREVGDAAIALHDRIVPGTRRNVDHVFVAPTGVWVVDAKSYAGRVEKRDVGPLWREENQVFVKGRDRTKLVGSVQKQVDAVVAALKPDPTLKGTNIYGALCFLDSEWPLLLSPFPVRGIWVLHPGALRKRLRKSGPLSREKMERIAHRLHLSLPPAAK
jgi:hypothetical protein